MAGKPLWRRAFDGAERRVAGPLESGVQSDVFADTVSLLVRTQDRLARELQRRSAGVLGIVNLPAGSDVKRLSRQVASLERQVRELSKQLEDERAAPPRARAKAGGRSASASRNSRGGATRGAGAASRARPARRDGSGG